MDESYIAFLEILKKYKEQRCIKMLHRGESKAFAFKCFNLDPKLHSIEQFSDSLYYFGSKSKHFWNKKLNPSKNLGFDINDISDSFFEYIFHEFNSLIENGEKSGTIRFFKKNKESKMFFNELLNVKPFIESIAGLPPDTRFFIRNYYLRILHQLGESEYYENSQFLSSTTKVSVAEWFSKKEIVINFWDLDFNRQELPSGVPFFNGKPYKNQREVSVFSVIFPQFIYSFKYQNKIYPNPAIKLTKNLEIAVLSGLEINQENFEGNLKNNTNFEKGVIRDGEIYREI